MFRFIRQIKSKPKAIKMSGTAIGGAWDLARAGMMLTADSLSRCHLGSFSGFCASIKELLGGHVDVVCCSLPEAAAQVRNGSFGLSVLWRPSVTPTFQAQL